MISLEQSGKTYVSRLRVKCSSADPLATQLRVAALLSVEDFHPPGLAPSAIICIRRLLDPMPRALSLQRGGLNLPRAWQQAVVTSLEQSSRHATYPLRDAVPADAACVIFADRAELLACLALDWHEGRTSQRWWWQSLFKSVSLADSIWPIWCDAPEYIPAALQHLSDKGRAVELARSLSAAQAALLLHSITHRYALHTVQAAIDFSSTGEDDEHADSGPTFESDTSSARVTDTRPASRSLDHKPAAPWRGLVPESLDSRLSFEQQSFLGIALMLSRAPSAARSVDFARRVRRWRGAAIGEETTTGAASTDRGGVQRQPANRYSSNVPQAAARSGNGRGERDTLSPPSGLDEQKNNPSHSHEPAPDHPALINQSPLVMRPPQTDQPAAATTEPQPDLARSSEQEPALHLHDLEHEAGHARRGAADAEGGPTAEPPVEAFAPSGVTPHVSDETPQPLSSIEMQIATEYGWLFYLINLGLFLNLYGDFTSPSEPGIPLDIWDFVALLGLQFAGEQVRADPIWLLLAQLSGRLEGEAPGQNFIPPDEWRVPPEWLVPFKPEGVWRWSASGGRLRVLHSAGFPVIDLPLQAEADPRERLQDETRAYQSFMGLAASDGASEAFEDDMPHVAPASATPFMRWTSYTMLYVRARLRRAFGLDDEEGFARVLCRQQARVFVTAARVDVMFALDQLPIEIRLSGLDRDPGWVPVAGRFISFHYD